MALGFQLAAAVQQAEPVHPGAWAHRVVQAWKLEQQQPVSRQKVASSLGPPPVWLAAFLAELRERQNESVSAQAREPVAWEQFSEQMASPAEAP